MIQPKWTLGNRLSSKMKSQLSPLNKLKSIWSFNKSPIDSTKTTTHSSDNTMIYTGKIANSATGPKPTSSNQVKFKKWLLRSILMTSGWFPKRISRNWKKMLEALLTSAIILITHNLSKRFSLKWSLNYKEMHLLLQWRLNLFTQKRSTSNSMTTASQASNFNNSPKWIARMVIKNSLP